MTQDPGGGWCATHVVQRIRFGQEQRFAGLEVQPVAALSERVKRVQGLAELFQVDEQRAARGAGIVSLVIGWIHFEMPSACHRNWYDTAGRPSSASRRVR